MPLESIQTAVHEAYGQEYVAKVVHVLHGLHSTPGWELDTIRTVLSDTTMTTWALGFNSVTEDIAGRLGTHR